MPELPEVETVRRGLAPHLEAAAIVRTELRRPDLRFPLPPDFAARLAGRRVTRLGRRAKYLLAELDSGEMLVMHLGMSGSFRVGGPALPARPHDHVVFHLADGKQVVFNDPRRFGMMDLVAADALPSCRHLAGLGIEPLDPDFDGARLAALMRHRIAPLKAALLDQRLIAGLGNIYVCESLWRAGLSPRREAGTLALKSGGPSARAGRLAAAIRDVIEEAIAVGGSSIRNHVQADGSIGSFQEAFSVYDRFGEPCRRPRCRGVVERVVQAGRSTFLCPACQR